MTPKQNWIATIMLLSLSNPAIAQTSIAEQIQELGISGTVVSPANSMSKDVSLGTFDLDRLDGSEFDLSNANDILGNNVVIVEQPDYAVIFGETGEALILVPSEEELLGFRWCQIWGTCTISPE